MNNGMYFLLIPCSKRKVHVENKIAALDLYDGPFYRIIKKIFREYGRPDNLDIVILSAKYGLITPDTDIIYYECRMTKALAKGFNDDLRNKFTSMIKSRNYQEIFLNIGRIYYEAIKGWDIGFDPKVKILYAEGGIGKRAKQMREWLLAKIGVKRE